jgi:hypothetical protein
LGSLVLLLALPVAVLTQVVFDSGSGMAIHVALAVGCVLVSLSTFYFGTPRWPAWVGSASAGAFAAIFLVQGGWAGFLLGTMAVTFWYSWMFNRTGGSVLITLISHAAQGTITIGGLWSVGADFARANLLLGILASAVAIGLVVFDRKAWRGPAATGTKPQAVSPRGAAPAATA